MRFADTSGYEQNIRPGFLGDVLTREQLLPGGIKLLASSFLGADDVAVTLGAAALQEATTLTVEALSGAIPSGTILNFGTKTAVTATVGAAGAAKGATSIPVAELSGPLPSGTVLDFGARAAVSVVVGAAGASANATTVPVGALSGPIPNETLLYFGGSKKFALLTAAAAAGATELTVQALPTALDEADTATYAAVTHRTAVLTAAADAGDTSLTVSALDEELVEDDAATYEDRTTVEARTTADAVEGDTSLAVAALDDEIADASVAYYRAPTIKKRIPAGTPVYLSVAGNEAAANGGSTAAYWSYAGNGQAVNATTDIVRLLAFDVIDVEDNNDAEVLRPFSNLIYVNHLPEWSGLDATVVAHIRSQYECMVGAPGQEVAADA